ncbi:J domain-containing protein [Psidium guajava]|nr:J domain-containing protein [Psidium guajava]
MYKRGGHMRGAVSQRRPAHSASSSSSMSLSSFPSLAPNPEPLLADIEHGHIGPSSDPQDPSPTVPSTSIPSPSIPSPSIPSPSVPSRSAQHSNDDGNRGEEDSRFMIFPYGDSFTDATYVVRQLNKIVNNYWRGEWISYSSAPEEVKDLWWNEFKRKFKWDEMEEDEVRRIFKKKAGDHIRNVMNKAKTRQVKPDFITEHRKRMADELGTEPTYTATFERTFQKKYKTWTGDRAKAIKEKYDELLMSTASGGDGVDGSGASSGGSDNMTLWVEASGGMKRGKIFGMGSLSRIYSTKVAATSSSNVAVSRRTRIEEQMTQELTQLKYILIQKDEEMKNLLVQKDEEIKMVKQQLSQKDERIKSLESQTQLILRHLNLNEDQAPPIPPTNQVGDGHDDEQHNDDEIADDDDDDYFVNRLID